MNVDYAPKIHGLPDKHEGPLPQYYQGNTNECAIYAQWNVLRDYGVKVDEATLVEQAKARGWFTDEGGTPLEHMGKLLELNGVQCDMMVDANRYNLINELAQGKRVIVTVDSSELWRENTALSRLWEGIKDVFGSGEDHAIVVSGIDTSDPDNIQVVLTDSGTGHRTISYPIEQFEDAWADGGCKMIVTRNPPPSILNLPCMANFDYDLGHIPSIGDTDFSVWQSMHSDQLDDCEVTAICEAAECLPMEGRSVSGDANSASEEILPGVSDRGGIATIVDAEDEDGDGVADKIRVDADEDGLPDVTIDLKDASALDELLGKDPCQ